VRRTEGRRATGGGRPARRIQQRRHMIRAAAGRRAKIVCTLGPATDRGTVLRRLVAGGMDVARLNFSHGTREEHVRRIAQVRAEAERRRRPVAIMQDLQGPKLRVGPLAASRGTRLESGRELLLAPGTFPGDATRIAIGYPSLARDVKAGDRILIGDGALELRVVGTRGRSVVARVIRGGLLLPHKGINLPGCAITAAALTRKDVLDLAVGLTHDVDFIALSFVRRPADLQALRRRIHAAGKEIPVIAKLEKPEAIQNLAGILAACDGVMVARGDLGVELSPEGVPLLPPAYPRGGERRGQRHSRRERCGHAQRGNRRRSLSGRGVRHDGPDHVQRGARRPDSDRALSRPSGHGLRPCPQSRRAADRPR